MNGIFPEGHSPVIELSKPEKGGLFPSQEEILARYRQLCRRDDLKLIITQLFALEEPLARAGIPCRVVHPSQESIQRAALDVLSHLKAVEMDGALTVSGVVSALDELDDLRKPSSPKPCGISTNYPPWCWSSAGTNRYLSLPPLTPASRS